MPVFALLLMYFLTSNAPRQGVMKPFVEACRTDWKNTLMLDFIYGYDFKMCFGQAWYLRTDYLLFLLSPFFVYLLKRYHLKAIALLASVIALLQFYRFNFRQR
jgi:peptidoglycan/LPS O-acetylase OafA/YrhL